MVARALPSLPSDFRMLARAICPDVRELDPSGWTALEAAAAQALAHRSPGDQRRFRRLIDVTRWLAVPMTGRTFGHLLPTDQTAHLLRLERSPIRPLRHAIARLRTAVLLGYYAQPAVRTALGWAGASEGWEAARPDPRVARLTPPARPRLTLAR